MSPRFSYSRALPGSPTQNQEWRKPGYSLRVTIPPFRLTAFLSGLVLVAMSLVQSPERQEPEALTPLILRGHTDQVNAVAFAPDGRTLASGSEDHTAMLWDVATSGRKTLILEHEATVYAVAFSPDGGTLATGGLDAIVRLWDAATGEERVTLQGHRGAVRALAFAPDGQTLASAGWDGLIRLWQPATGHARASLRGHVGWIRSVAFAPDGRTLASGSADATVRLWDRPPGTVSRQMANEPAAYWDFVYYNFIIGIACATADVNVMGRVGTNQECAVDLELGDRLESARKSAKRSRETP